MSDTYQWRRKFIELVEALFRELGFDPPAMTHDPESPLVMDLQVSGINFEIVHSSKDHPEQFQVECCFGSVPGDRTLLVLTRLLQVNLTLARAHEATFGANSETGKIIYVFPELLEAHTAAGVLEILAQIAVQAKEWQATFYLSEEEAPIVATNHFETLA